MKELKKNDKVYKLTIHLSSDKLQAHKPNMSSNTAAIINEFYQLVDAEKVYDLKELKQILADVYNTKNGKKTAKKPAAKKLEDTGSSSSDDEKAKKRGRPTKAKLDKDGNPKPKKAPSAYNNYVKVTISALKKENPETAGKELMGMAAAGWKLLTQEEKDSYKTDKMEVDADEVQVA